MSPPHRTTLAENALRNLIPLQTYCNTSNAHMEPTRPIPEMRGALHVEILCSGHLRLETEHSSSLKDIQWQ